MLKINKKKKIINFILLKNEINCSFFPVNISDVSSNLLQTKIYRLYTLSCMVV